jgi:Glycosyl transferase family 2
MTDPAASVRLTVIVPATNTPATLSACLAAIAQAESPPEQVIVVTDPTIKHPALARNHGAESAVGDVLVFVDADVTVHRDVFVRVRHAFDVEPTLTAVFGSYDDAPSARGVVSVTRNLLHHHVHQRSAGRASTFWAGLGAIRRDAFQSVGGFSVHPIEDIELGMRLSATGAVIMLDPTIQGTHLKDWSLYNMMRTDLLVRGIPWVGLLMERRSGTETSNLNLGWVHRLSALSCVALVLALLMWNAWIAMVALSVLLVCNRQFYGLLVRREGLLRAAGGVAVHIIHLLVAVASVPIGMLLFMLRKRTTKPAKLAQVP